MTFPRCLWVNHICWFSWQPWFQRKHAKNISNNGAIIWSKWIAFCSITNLSKILQLENHQACYAVNTAYLALILPAFQVAIQQWHPSRFSVGSFACADISSHCLVPCDVYIAATVKPDTRNLKRGKTWFQSVGSWLYCLWAVLCRTWWGGDAKGGCSFWDSSKQRQRKEEARIPMLSSEANTLDTPCFR